jgi:hypothetical protein
MMMAEDAQNIIAPRLVGLPLANIFAMYGPPDASQVQDGHHVYYWQRTTAFTYRDQYTATTQGTVGYGEGVPFNSTTTTQGPMNVGAITCELGVGATIDGDTVERVRFRGADCEVFMRNPHRD